MQGRKGLYRIRLMDNKYEADTAYPGVVVLPDGTFVVTTYGHRQEGGQPYIVSVRITLEEVDERRGGDASSHRPHPDQSGAASMR